MNIFDLSNRVALVTGASYGIGFAIAKGLAEAGAAITFNVRREDLVKQGVEHFKKSGITARGYVCDITDEKAVGELVAKIEQEVGVIDITRTDGVTLYVILTVFGRDIFCKHL